MPPRASAAMPSCRAISRRRASPTGCARATPATTTQRFASGRWQCRAASSALVGTSPTACSISHRMSRSSSTRPSSSSTAGRQPRSPARCGNERDHCIHRLRRHGSAERLIDAGYTVRLFDPRPAAMAPLVKRGGVAAKSPRDAATGAAVAFACLPAPEISRTVAYGTDGVINAPSLRTYVEMSTIGSPAVQAIAAELTKKNIVMIDSPVSGGPRGARAGTLATMVAGEHAAFERVKPMLQALARNVFYVGDRPGLGQVVKLAN